MPRHKTNRTTEKTIRPAKKQLPSMGVIGRSLLRELLPKTRWVRRLVYGLLAVAALVLLSSYGIAQWYINKHKNEPLVIGATFIPNYAEFFGLDPKETLHASIHDLGVKDYRLVSYWKNHEKQPDQYDFSELDWQFDMIEQAGGTVSLSIGLRQPRWPECHEPKWFNDLPDGVWQEELKEYMSEVINRYKDREVLISYQLENEYFLDVFGHCPDHSRERLVDEYNFVKSLDNSRPVIISRSNNAVPSWPVGQPRPDMNAASIYKRVWDGTITKRYFEYPLPAWFYAFLAGGAELTTGRNTFIHELQTEAWLPKGMDMRTAPKDELYKSSTPERVRSMMYYGRDTGMRRMDLWGIEWWYFMKTKRDTPEFWNSAKQTIADIRADEATR